MRATASREEAKAVPAATGSAAGECWSSCSSWLSAPLGPCPMVSSASNAAIRQALHAALLVCTYTCTQSHARTRAHTCLQTPTILRYEHELNSQRAIKDRQSNSGRKVKERKRESGIEREGRRTGDGASGMCRPDCPRHLHIQPSRRPPLPPLAV